MIAFARYLLAVPLVLLAACSGSVDPSPNVNDPTRVTVLPATATLYSGLPTTFVLSGGTGSYIVTSSNQAVLPISGNVLTKSFVAIPSPVSADTEVTLTVRDTGTAPLATAVLTVRPGTVANTITITPTPSNDPTNNPDCRPAVCTGSDAEASVVISQGGVPLAARGVRFEVVTGDFRFITSPAGAVEVLGLQVTTTTDETGKARARFRATALVPSQTATLRIVDIGSGAYQLASFTIAQFTGNPSVFFVTPPGVTFAGPRIGVCASGVQAEFTIHGGTPPYSISGNSSAFTVSPTTVNASEGRFNVFASGVCAPPPGLSIGVTDATGRTVSVTVVNQEGTTAAPPLVVAPTSVTLNSCADRANVSVGGGVGTIRAFANTITLDATVGANVVSITRVRGATPPPVPVPPSTESPARVSVTDGVTVAEVQVFFGPGALSCP